MVLRILFHGVSDGRYPDNRGSRRIGNLRGFQERLNRLLQRRDSTSRIGASTICFPKPRSRWLCAAVAFKLARIWPEGESTVRRAENPADSIPALHGFAWDPARVLVPARKSGGTFVGFGLMQRLAYVTPSCR